MKSIPHTSTSERRWLQLLQHLYGVLAHCPLSVLVPGGHDVGVHGSACYVSVAGNSLPSVSNVANVQARPILRKLITYSRVQGHCVGALEECSSIFHC